MKILLSYSKYHFDPKKSRNLQKNWGQSASILARSFYKILRNLGEVTYTDQYGYKEHAGKNFDLFVGINGNFSRILKACRTKRSIYVGVNMHPTERNKIIKNFQIKNLIPKAAVSWGDLVEEKPAIASINAADMTLLAGNMKTYYSYINNGVPDQKVKIFNYGLDEPVKIARTKKHRKTVGFIYLASEIGLRKGFDIVFNLFNDPRIARKDFHLLIVGKPSTEYYEKKINKLVKSLPHKITYLGWIDSKTKKYKEILDNADFLLFPSLEEGQAGTVIDSMARGIVPVVSENSGIDFSPLGAFELKKKSRNNIMLLLNALGQSRKDIENLKKKTLEYYEEFHMSFEQNIKESIENFLDGNSYPKVSVILSVFNKEQIITDLLGHLHLALEEYKNVELFVIFDGCTDKSREKADRFFKKVKPSYKITFRNTPNVFEVKSNNMGLKLSTGKYCVIVQDDNFIYDRKFLFEAVNFLDRDPKAVVLGGLAGVNFYPRGYKLEGPGQITMAKNEVYWRQDEKSDPTLKNKVFQVDACMRGPLILRRSFLERHGYLDEAYAPLYNDDMDLCMRANSLGYKVYAMLMNVENKTLTIGAYDEKRAKWWAEIIKKNSDTFYSRWKPSIKKDYLWIMRPRQNDDAPKIEVPESLHKIRYSLYSSFADKGSRGRG